jgi:hypothetical protein
MSTLVLDTTTKTIKVVMSGAATTTNPDFTASFADNNGTTFIEAASDGALTGASDATVVSAPASGYRRVIKKIFIENKDTAAVTITVKYDNNGTQRNIVKVTLQVGDTWSTDGTYDTNGALKQTLGSVNLNSVTGTLAVANGGTGVTTSTGTGSTVLSTSPTLVTPLLGTPTSGVLTNATGLPLTTGVTGNLPVTNLNSGTSASSTTYWRGDGTWASVPSTPLNRIINGAMRIAQRGTSGTSGSGSPPATAPVYPCVDRFYVYATGATVTASQTTSSNVNYLSIAGAASVTAVSIGQRIEASNSFDLASSTATLSLNISNSLLTTVTWTASYATSNDTWSAKTQIATGTFTVTSTLTNYSAQITVPSAATTGIEILLTVGAQTSGTWVINNMQLEKSAVASAFNYRLYNDELLACQRYYEKISYASGTEGIVIGFAQNDTTARYAFPIVLKRTTPTLAYSGPLQVEYGTGTTTSVTALANVAYGGGSVVSLYFTVASSLTSGQAICLYANAGTVSITFSSEV